MIKLYSSDICPYAQRVRAVLVRLGQKFETVSVDLSNRDSAFLELTPTGKVPLMLEGDLKLYESQVICDYLAERKEWKEAYASDPKIRNRQRLAMKQWDAVVLPAWYRGLQAPSSFDGRIRERVTAEIAELAATVALDREHPDSLPGYHFAPFWARIQWMREALPLAAIMEEDEVLKGWLDKALDLPSIQQTLPDREAAVRKRESPASSSS